MDQFDLLVVGSGPAGRRGAIQAAKLGKKVLVIEQGKRVGGVSVHTGTIPSKTLRETALNLSGWRERGFYGRAYRVKQEISAEDLRRRLLITLDHEVEVLEHQFARNRVQHIRGKASFVDPAQQADALFILAEAKYALALNKKDAGDLKDAALAYMRVVANFKDAPNHPHVPESLLRTANIEEQLNDAPAAQLLYQQIAQQYPDDPIAAVAKQKIQK